MWVLLAAAPAIASLITPPTMLTPPTLLSSTLLRPVFATALLKPSSTYGRTSKLVSQIDGWTTAIDEESGDTYYYNELTGQSQWEPPQVTGTQNCQVRWRVEGVTDSYYSALDPEMRHRYSLGIDEEQVLSRWNLLEEKLTVSRKQCIVKIIADGTATLVSEGKAPTLWRQPGGPWNPLPAGDQVTLSDGDQVSIDCDDPEGAVFTCQEESAVQQGDVQGGYQQDGYAQLGQLPYPWEQVDENGEVYYYNLQTGESSWEPPQSEY